MASVEATARGRRNVALNHAAWTLGRWVAAGARCEVAPRSRRGSVAGSSPADWCDVDREVCYSELYMARRLTTMARLPAGTPDTDGRVTGCPGRHDFDPRLTFNHLALNHGCV
jgi:hypothetical protein